MLDPPCRSHASHPGPRPSSPPETPKTSFKRLKNHMKHRNTIVKRNKVIVILSHSEPKTAETWPRSGYPGRRGISRRPQRGQQEALGLCGQEVQELLLESMDETEDRCILHIISYNFVYMYQFLRILLVPYVIYTHDLRVYACRETSRHVQLNMP